VQASIVFMLQLAISECQAARRVGPKGSHARHASLAGGAAKRPALEPVKKVLIRRAAYASLRVCQF
jgi:hypothetical protein